MFPFGDAWSLVWGLNPQKPPVATGLYLPRYHFSEDQCMVAKIFIT